MGKYEEELVGPTEQEDLQKYEEEKRKFREEYEGELESPIRLSLVGEAYWHMTPYRNLNGILSEGLKPNRTSSLALGFEDVAGKIFIANDPADCYAQLALSDYQGKWSLIELDMGGYPHHIFFDESGFSYTTHPISSNRVVNYSTYDSKRERRGKGLPERFGPFKELV